MIGQFPWVAWICRIVAVGVLLLGLAAQADINEPFGLSTVVAPEGPWWVTWRDLRSEIQSEKPIIAQCRAEPDFCTSPAALRFIAIVDEGRQYEGLARIGHINRAINFSIRPISTTAQRDIHTTWISPLAVLASGKGDCKQYAILKYVVLSDIGFAPDDLRLIIVAVKSRQENHVVLAVRNAGRWLILDNRSLALIDSSELYDYLPLYTLDYRGVRQFVLPFSPIISGSPCNGVIG
jgi:predicted transglutaminase-like cysteine proteinase